MCKNNYSFLIQDSFPDLVKLLNSKKVDNYLQVATNVQLIHFQFRPGLAQISVEFLVSRINQLIVVEVCKKHLNRAGEAKFEISKERKRANYCESFLQIRPSDFIVVCFHLFSYFDLLEV